MSVSISLSHIAAQFDEMEFGWKAQVEETTTREMGHNVIPLVEFDTQRIHLRRQQLPKNKVAQTNFFNEWMQDIQTWKNNTTARFQIMKKWWKQLQHNYPPLQQFELLMSRARRRFGVTKHQQKRVEISTFFIANENTTMKQMRNLLLHEAAHVLTPGAQHGPVWKLQARNMGCNANRCELYEVPPPRRVMECACGIYARHKIHKKFHNNARSCTKCHAPFEIKPNRQQVQFYKAKEVQGEGGGKLPRQMQRRSVSI